MQLAALAAAQPHQHGMRQVLQQLLTDLGGVAGLRQDKKSQAQRAYNKYGWTGRGKCFAASRRSWRRRRTAGGRQEQEGPHIECTYATQGQVLQQLLADLGGVTGLRDNKAR